MTNDGQGAGSAPPAVGDAGAATPPQGAGPAKKKRVRGPDSAGTRFARAFRGMARIEKNLRVKLMDEFGFDAAAVERSAVNVRKERDAQIERVRASAEESLRLLASWNEVAKLSAALPPEDRKLLVQVVETMP